MDKIQEIIYFPTLRCNLNCKHCGENQDIPKDEELDSLAVLEQIKNSILLDTQIIHISGGEPFLNSTFSTFILTGLRQTPYHFSIISNGYFSEKIADMTGKIAPEDKARISMTISIDGLRETHNAIRRNAQSFDHAIQTVKCLVQQGFSVNINIVALESNLHELSQLRQFFKDISPDICTTFIPVSVDISEEKSFIYTEQYQTLLWPELQEPLFRRKQVLSKGKYFIRNCHAGKKNIIIGPDGKIYACLTGAYYLAKEQRDMFLLGDLKQSTLDEILTNEEQRNFVYDHAVKACTGCSNSCEINREVNLFDLNIGISPQEIQAAFKLERDRVIGSALLDYSGWHAIEKAVDGRRWCWSSSTMAKVFISPGPENSRKWKRGVLLSYTKIVPELKVKVLLNGTEVFIDNEIQCERVIQFPIPELSHNSHYVLTFITDMMYSPSKLFGSTDTRELGVCLLDVSLQ